MNCLCSYVTGCKKYEMLFRAAGMVMIITAVTWPLQAQHATFTGPGAIRWDYVNGYAEVSGGAKTFTSYVPAFDKRSDESEISKMLQLDLEEVLKIQLRMKEFGLLAATQAGVTVDLELFAYDPNASGGIGNALYQVTLPVSSPTSYEGSVSKITYDLTQPHFDEQKLDYFDSDNILQMMKGARLYYWSTCKQAIQARDSHYFTRHRSNGVLYHLWGGFLRGMAHDTYLGDRLMRFPCGSNQRMRYQPVIMKITKHGDGLAHLKKVKIPGLGEKDVTALFGIGITASTPNLSGLTDPNPDRTENIAFYKDLGGIQVNKYYWGPINDENHVPYWIQAPVEAEKYLEGQGITMAKMDLSDPSKYRGLYDLKFTYRFKNPAERGTPNVPVGGDVIPEECMYADKPLGGQFDILSHAAAREGAIFGINGTYYDYYYRCIPSIRQYIKVNDQVMAYPTVTSHKLQGAFAFDFSQTPPVRFQAVDIHNPNATDAHPDNLGSYTEPNIFRELQGYPNIMSGGHYSYIRPDGTKSIYEFQVPLECQDGQTHPWPNLVSDATNYPFEEGQNGNYMVNDWKTLKWIVDPNNNEGWFYLACQRSADGYNGYYKDFFRCDKLDPGTQYYEQYRSLFTCIDSYRAVDEFGGQNRQIRKARTFVAWKNDQLYFVTVDGMRRVKNKKDEQGNDIGGTVKDDSQWGFTIEELGRFFDQMGFENLVHMDGGTSTEFFVNGRGMLQRTIKSFATLDGPLRQRYTSAFILVVPELNVDEIEGIGFNKQFLELDNLDPLKENKAILSLTPSLAKLTEHDGEGLLTSSFKVDQTEPADGAVIFSLSHDTYEHAQSLFVAGVGKIPASLADSLEGYEVCDDTERVAYRRALSRNNQAFYQVRVENNEVVSWSFTAPGQYQKYLDGQWHTFALYNLRDREGLVVDGEVYPQSRSYQPGTPFFNLGHLTHGMMGGMMLGGRYIVGQSKLSLDDVGFITNSEQLELLARETADCNALETSLVALTSAKQSYPMAGIYPGWHQAGGAYFLTMEEQKGMHAFAADTQGRNKFWGLMLHGERNLHAQNERLRFSSHWNNGNTSRYGAHRFINPPLGNGFITGSVSEELNQP